ncbi:hypothetical protein O181_074189 [Austropuccinia psidii MF-1]|uniref:Uncharacterized protein n=1 Tax=Austropuccinia psidii MF-1 TaxID=1389203 RepID=A0A9Q3ID80_9BASI|nr:hypothetical protein [Austropuccinia psidii MF-1]
MEYKYHEWYTHEFVKLLPAIQLAHSTSKHSTTERSPSIMEKGWCPLLSVDHLNRNFLAIHPTAKDLYYMCKRECDTEARFLAEEKEYNKQRYDKTHKEPEFSGNDQVLVSTLSFSNLKGPKKMRDSFLVPFTIIRLIGKDAVEVKLTEEFSRKPQCSQ